jgi:leader peptidase (prepilin peptidase)/N-methyltransferase
MERTTVPLLLIAAGLLGLAVGSFLNVVVHRVPRAMSLSHPGSHCPACSEPIRHRHNVPVLGWLLLRGRCADCATSISIRYPLVELATALLFVAVTARLAQLDLLTALPAFLWFVAIGIALALIDLEVRRLPDAITLPAYPVLAALLIVATLVDGQVDALLRAALGALASFALYYLLAAAKPGGMGWGDVKTAGLIGGMLGYISWPVLLVGTASAFALGAVVGIGSILARRATRTSSVPFGPFMVTGALAAVFVGAPLADAYQHLLLSA